MWASSSYTLLGSFSFHRNKQCLPPGYVSFLWGSQQPTPETRRAHAIEGRSNLNPGPSSKKGHSDSNRPLHSAMWLFPKIRETQYRPQYIIILIMGNPKKGTPNFGKPPCVSKTKPEFLLQQDLTLTLALNSQFQE